MLHLSHFKGHLDGESTTFPKSTSFLLSFTITKVPQMPNLYFFFLKFKIIIFFPTYMYMKNIGNSLVCTSHTDIIQPSNLQLNHFVSFSTPFSQLDLEMPSEKEFTMHRSSLWQWLTTFSIKKTVFFSIQIAELNCQPLDLVMFLSGRLKISPVSSL